MNIPKELKYEKTDEWVKLEGKTATIGISDYAQEQLSDIVYVDITLSVGDKVKKGSYHCHDRVGQSRCGCQHAGHRYRT